MTFFDFAAAYPVPTFLVVAGVMMTLHLWVSDVLHTARFVATAMHAQVVIAENDDEDDEDGRE